MNMRRLLRTGLVLLALLTLRTGWAVPPEWAGPPTWAGQPGGRPTLNYHALYVFGDSLSDTGNDRLLTAWLGLGVPVPPSASPHRTFWEGRFSDGPVAVERLWNLLSGTGELVSPSLAVGWLPQALPVSFAYGGSGSGGWVTNPGGFPVAGVLAQVDLFRQLLPGGQANRQALYVVWTGANDYLFGSGNPESGYQSDPRAVVSNIVQAIERLYAMGAREFLVPNLPELARTPLVQWWRTLPEQEALLQLTTAHNAILSDALAAMRSWYPGIRVYGADMSGLVRELLDEGLMAPGPALEYLAPGSGASVCLFQQPYPAACPDVALEAARPPIMFWDALHPTTFAHEMLARRMYLSIQQGQ